MKKTKKFLPLFSVLALALAFGATTSSFGVLTDDNSAFAQQNRQVKTRPKQNASPQMSPEAFAIFEQVQIELDAENYAAASELAEKMLSRKGISNFEMAMGYQLRGFIAYQQEDINTAIREYTKILQFTDIPYATTDSIRYQLAQFLSMEGRYQESLKQLEEWFLYQPEPTAQNYFFKAQIHYQYGIELDKNPSNKRQADAQFQQGVRDVETTIAMGKADPMIDIQENWYQVQSALYFQLENYKAVADVLEIMIVKWPRPQYWVQLSAMYSELEQFEKQLAVLDVAYRLGFLEKEANIVTIAQLYSINGIPYLAAKVLEENMKPKMVDGKQVTLVDPEDEKNLTLLGQSFLVSKEYRKSTGPLERAANLSEDGKLYMQLGSVYSTMEDWANAASAVQLALKKEGLDDRAQAYLYLGLAYLNFREFTKAEEAFRQARRVADKDDKKTAKQVGEWLKYIAAEKQRLQRLAASGITPSK